MALLNILCVDDNHDILEIARLALSLDPQIEARTASSGAEALRILLSPDWPVHCLLLDIRMPDEDGHSLFGRIRAIPIHETTPVIFLTANVRQEDVEQCRQLGALAVLPKPFQAETLARQVRGILNRLA